MPPLKPADTQTFGQQQLFLILQERIKEGRYAPGAWLPAERALADEFGMDRSAVRRTLIQLEGSGLIVRETGKRPWVRGGPASAPPSVHRRPRIGGRADAGQIGSGQANAGLRTIVALLPHHPLFPASLGLLRGINAALRSAEAPVRLQVIDTHGGSEQREILLEAEALDSIAREEIAGVILWHLGGNATLPQLRTLEQQGIPVVFVDRFPAGVTCDFVGGDNHAGIEAAVEYLRLLGHRRIAHLTDDDVSTAVLERRIAYHDALLAGGLVPNPDWVYSLPRYTPAAVGPACDHFFSLPEPPTAVVAMNDSLAYHFLAECQTRGIRIPEDVSLVGFDDLDQHSPRPGLLTTLHQPFDKMGRRAAALLLRRLAGPESPPAARQHILLPMSLVKRATCLPVSPPRPSVRFSPRSGPPRGVPMRTNSGEPE